MIKPLTKGPRALISKINEIIHAINSANKLSGSKNGLASVSHSPFGANVRVNSKSVEARIPKTAVAGGVGFTLWAKLTEDATDSSIITGNIFSQKTGLEPSSGAGFNVELHAEMLNASRLDMVMPRLLEDDVVPVVSRNYDNEGAVEKRWYINCVFYGSEDIVES